MSSNMKWGGEKKSDLYSIKPDGAEKKVLADSPDPEIFLAVTHSNKVIYNRIAGERQGDIYIVNADGSNETPLAKSEEPDMLVRALQ